MKNNLDKISVGLIKSFVDRFRSDIDGQQEQMVALLLSAEDISTDQINSLARYFIEQQKISTIILHFPMSVRHLLDADIIQAMKECMDKDKNHAIDRLLIPRIRESKSTLDPELQSHIQQMLDGIPKKTNQPDTNKHIARFLDDVKAMVSKHDYDTIQNFIITQGLQAEKAAFDTRKAPRHELLSILQSYNQKKLQHRESIRTEMYKYLPIKLQEHIYRSLEIMKANRKLQEMPFGQQKYFVICRLLNIPMPREHMSSGQ